jgi:hypothetical protein
MSSQGELAEKVDNPSEIHATGKELTQQAIGIMQN